MVHAFLCVYIKPFTQTLVIIKYIPMRDKGIIT